MSALGDNGIRRGGVMVYGTDSLDIETAQRGLMGRLEELGLARDVEIDKGMDGDRRFVRFRLRDEQAREWTPGYDTMQLCRMLKLDTRRNSNDLEREILLAMLAGPLPFEFPSHEELACAIRIRKNIVAAARKTALSFHTSEAERPADYWTYAEGRGFTILPGKSLITALQKATQPEQSGTLYSFSCYRATEYVILLGIAEELATCNPDLYHRLQKRWESSAIMSGQFHDVFLREHGSMTAPLPMKYFVPGDRTWFRNPDPHSSDIAGYEGSWVMYLGGGLFTNFWKRDQPYTLAGKCIEIYHWRDAAYRDESGELRIDEAVVEKKVGETLADPDEARRIFSLMLRYREPSGIYVDGGCIDTTREYARWVCPGTADLTIPDIDA